MPNIKSAKKRVRIIEKKTLLTKLAVRVLLLKTQQLEKNLIYLKN